MKKDFSYFAVTTAAVFGHALHFCFVFLVAHLVSIIAKSSFINLFCVFVVFAKSVASVLLFLNGGRNKPVMKSIQCEIRK